MTRDQLELVCQREGLTRPQTSAVLIAAEAYAITQAKLAVAGPATGPAIHYRDDFNVPACDRSGRLADPVVTLSRRHVTCERCKRTLAWQEAGAA